MSQHPVAKVPLKIIELEGVSIMDQLLYEEYLLRDTQDNICIINHGSSPAIVMGISGKLEELVHIDKASDLNIPIIKRFSGGGTVVVDEDTLFVTFIFNSKDINVPCFPEPIYKFSETIYKDVFKDLPFELKQNDYVFGSRKFGGNAQYIKKDRWLHHTSFLYDYRPEFMQLLKHPKKTPEYRNGRNHEEFICKLKSHLEEKSALSSYLKQTLGKLFDVTSEDFSNKEIKPSRTSTTLILDGIEKPISF
jgi:lipoate-protein ligase A